MKARAIHTRTVIVGASRSGKSTLFSFLVDCLPKVFLVDPRGRLPDPAPGRGTRFRAEFARGEEIPAEGELFDLVQAVCVQAHEAGPCTVAVDEAELACKGSIGKRTMPPALHEIVKRGAHLPRGAKVPRPVGFLVASQRPQDMDRVITAQAGETFVFRLQEPGDVEHMVARGFDRGQILALPPHHYLHGGDDWIPHIHEALASKCPAEARRKV